METPSLRQRKKAAAMAQIQQVAVDLFEEKGFDAVTIEAVAEAAEVSPSTVYRYFGTKEKLVLADQFDDLALRQVVGRVAAGEDPAVAMRTAVAATLALHFTDDVAEQTVRRTRLWMTHPAVRRAGMEMFDEVVEGLAVAFASVTPVDVGTARLAAGAVVWPLMAAIRNWHDDGADPATWTEHLDRAMAVMPERIRDWPGADAR